MPKKGDWLEFTEQEHLFRKNNPMEQMPLQLPLPISRGWKPARKARSNGRVNMLDPQDRPFHDWYRFVLSFPPHLVRDYIDNFEVSEHHVMLDPFCGTGTTLVEAKLRGIQAIGVEANPFAHLASSVKVDWGVDPDILAARARDIASATLGTLREQGIDDTQPFDGDIDDISLRTLEPETFKLLIKNSISPLPLHKVLVLLDYLREHRNEPYYKHGLLALAKALVFSIGNLRFGPEVGVGKCKDDVQVVASWLAEVDKMATDLRLIAGQSHPKTPVYLADARELSGTIRPNSIDAIITSPPYPNEKDYSRTTRLESVILGFANSRADLRGFKKTFVRSNTRGVYKDDSDDEWVAHNSKVQSIASEIERRRVELGKTSGFEKLYGRVTRLYFGGMARHLAGIRPLLRPGAQLAYVVGDQASYLRVMIRTGQLLAEIAQSLGYELVRIDLFRTRFSTATKEQLREEVVVLRWAGRER